LQWRLEDVRGMTVDGRYGMKNVMTSHLSLPELMALCLKEEMGDSMREREGPEL
jgi:hypothetical protein